MGTRGAAKGAFGSVQLGLGAENPAADLCAECKGWCCYRFVCNVRVKRDWSIDWDAMGEVLCPEDLEFVRTNFKRVYCDRKHQSAPGKVAVAFTCAMYDPDEGSCSAYERRPALCRKFVCGAAFKEKRVPVAADFQWQATAMRRAGVPV